MKQRNRINGWALPVLLLSLLSCQRYKAQDEVINKSDTYFSIKQYAQDQIQMLAGQPQSLYKISKLNGAVDTTVTNFLQMDWTPIFNVIKATDISDKKFIGLYNFNMYDDDVTATRGLIYTAKDPNVLTRTLQISTDPSNNRITSIYIETAKHDFWGSTTQKILYIPMRIIQIQEAQDHLVGKARNLRVEYRFMRDDDEAEQI